MTRPVPVRRPFETPLAVSDLEGSVRFCHGVVGPSVAIEVPERGAGIPSRSRALVAGICLGLAGLLGVGVAESSFGRGL